MMDSLSLVKEQDSSCQTGLQGADYKAVKAMLAGIDRINMIGIALYNNKLLLR